jgi:PiT family inorganic phosphate transporter
MLYNFVNGMNDCANSIATTVSTRALSPRLAVLLAAVLNIAGAFVSTEVAKTIGKGVVNPDVIMADKTVTDPVTLGIVIMLAAVLGAAIWGFGCTHFGIPISITHALVGGLFGAGIVGYGFDCINMDGITLIMLAMVISPIVGFAGAYIMMVLVYRISVGMHPSKATSVYKKLQVVSASWMAFSHGFNDTQNAMGVITATLLFAGKLTPTPGDPFPVPVWVILSSAAVMGLGTYIGGWSVIKTMGMGIVNLKPIHGFTAETAAGSVIAGCSFFGAPISTTHVISTSIMGVGSVRKLSGVKWGTAFNIVLTWIFTLPGAAIIGAGSFFLLKMFFL